MEESLSADAIFTENLLQLTACILQHCKKQMLNRDILISHLLCFIFCMDQHIIQVLTDISLTSLYLRSLADCLLDTVNKELALNVHLLK